MYTAFVDSGSRCNPLVAGVEKRLERLVFTIKSGTALPVPMIRIITFSLSRRFSLPVGKFY